MIKITSFANPKIKDVVKLRERRERIRTGLTVVEGIREVAAAIKAGVEISEVFICPSLYEGQIQGDVDAMLRGLKDSVEVSEVSKEIFAKICFGERSEGIVALGRARIKTLKDLKLKKNPLLMLIERVEKPGNLGAILRTCDAAGIDALLVCDPATDIYNPNVIRASLGTVFSVDTVAGSTEEIAGFLKSNKIKVVAATPSGNKKYTSLDFRAAVVLALGSEMSGLSDFWLKTADEKAFIPMKGEADSLNTSVAAALMAYEAIRQRESS
jgi:TrmH family RNA methyltransferase